MVNVPGWYNRDVADSNAYAVYPSDGVVNIVDTNIILSPIPRITFWVAIALNLGYSVNHTYIDTSYV